MVWRMTVNYFKLTFLLFVGLSLLSSGCIKKRMYESPIQETNKRTDQHVKGQIDKTTDKNKAWIKNSKIGTDQNRNNSKTKSDKSRPPKKSKNTQEHGNIVEKIHRTANLTKTGLNGSINNDQNKKNSKQKSGKSRSQKKRTNKNDMISKSTINTDQKKMNPKPKSDKSRSTTKSNNIQEQTSLSPM